MKTRPAVPAANTTLANPDPSRWAILFGLANTAVPAWVDLDVMTGTNQGFPLTAQAPVLAWNFRDLGVFVQQQWFGFGAPGGQLRVVEILYRPVDVEIVTPEMMQELADRLQDGDVLSATKLAR